MKKSILNFDTKDELRAEIERLEKKVTLWQILTGVGGGLFVVSLIGVFVMRAKLKKK